MKNKIGEIFFGRNSKVSALLVLGVFVIVGLGCFGKSKTAGTIPAAYLGDWQGQDGTLLSIRADGTGDYKAGNTSVSGGTAEVNETDKTISITFVGMGKTLRIDEPPVGDQMKLDGIVFRRRGGFSPSSSSNTSVSNAPLTADSPSTSSPPNKNPFPIGDDSGEANTRDTSASDDASADEVEVLVKETLMDFTMGVEQGSLDDLHANSSKEFQRAFPLSRFNSEFQSYFDKKEVVLPVLKTVDNTSADFSPAPSIRKEGSKEILVANGSFPTKPYKTIFEFEYQKENGVWKLQKIRVKM